MQLTRTLYKNVFTSVDTILLTQSPETGLDENEDRRHDPSERFQASSFLVINNLPQYRFFCHRCQSVHMRRPAQRIGCLVRRGE